ncbi:MAG: ABC transporter permease [Solirubrobacterales bacterium]
MASIEPGNAVTNPPVGSDLAAAEDAVAAQAARVARRNAIWTAIGRYGIIAMFVVMLIVFSVLKPDNFPTYDNAKAILQQAAILAVLGIGLTVVLVIREFDLSFEANAALSGAIAVQLLVNSGFPTALGVLAGILVGLVVGSANGLIVAYGRASAFIGTLAIASVAAGLNSMITDDKTVYGVPSSYLGLSTTKILGIPLFIFISIACVIGIWALLKFTVFGRHAQAVGSNPVAAATAGVRTKEVRFAAFAILGAMAGLAGVLITAQGGGSSPGNAAGVLLPVYTAAFLGLSALGRGQFNAIATYFGVIFIGTLQTGLTMLNQPSWIASVITGSVLVAAVLIARRQ